MEHQNNLCLRRSMYAGLSWAGIKDNCAWIPPSPDPKWVERIQERYPKLFFNFAESKSYGANPVIVVYRNGIILDGKHQTHAVFLTDIDPFVFPEMERKIACIISGWETL